VHAMNTDAVLCTLIFFFQAEDGIRDRNVTGVQTCALPICVRASEPLQLQAVFQKPQKLIGFDELISIVTANITGGDQSIKSIDGGQSAQRFIGSSVD